MPNPAKMWKLPGDGADAPTATAVPSIRAVRLQGSPPSFLVWIFVAASGLASLGCARSDDPVAPSTDPVAEAQRALDVARARWSDAGLESYALRLARSCANHCTFGVVRVEVVNGTVRTITELPSWIPLAGALFQAYAFTVEDLFNEIQPHIELADRPHLFRVEYHADLGYPTSVRVSPPSSSSEGNSEVSFDVSSLTDIVPVEMAQQELDAARVRWSDAGIETYALELTRVCVNCVGAVKVEVRNGTVHSVTVAATGEPPPGYAASSYDFTILDLLARIQHYIYVAARPDHFAVSYDRVLGYPTTIRIIPHEISHSELLFNILSLTVLDDAGN